MRGWITKTLGSVILAAMLVASTAGAQGTTEPLPPACSVVAGLPEAVPLSTHKETPLSTPRAKSSSRAAAFTLQCNYRMGAFMFFPASQKRIREVGSTPKIVGGAPGDSMGCYAYGCQGSVAAGARVRVGARLHRATCEKPRFRLKLTATLAASCTGACTFELGAVARSGRLRGCGQG